MGMDSGYGTPKPKRGGKFGRPKEGTRYHVSTKQLITSKKKTANRIGRPVPPKKVK